MSDDQSFSPEEVKKLRQLLEIEEIKKVKLLYSQLMDLRDVDGLAEIFAEDAVCEFGPYGSWHGKKEIHEKYREVFDGGVPYGGFHSTTNQWVEMTGPTSAVSRTYLHDIVHEPDPRTNPFIWFGIYDEDYEKINGEWKIKRCTLQFLWPQRLITGEWPGPFPPPT